MNTHDFLPLAKRVKRERERLGMTQEGLGKKTQMSQITIWRIENSRTVPNALEIARIARVLKVSIDYLLEEDSTEEMREKIRAGVEKIPLEELSAIARKVRD